MKKILTMAVLIAPLAVMAIEDYDIRFTKKTASKRESGSQQLARVSTRAVTESIYYLIEIRRKTATSPAKVEVEYGAMVEGTGGRLYMRGYGSKQIYIDFGKTIQVESDSIQLSGREFDGYFRKGSIEEDIEGFGVRVKGEDGKVLSEKYSSRSIERELREELDKRDELGSKREKLENGDQEGVENEPKRPLPPWRRNRPPLRPLKR